MLAKRSAFFLIEQSTWNSYIFVWQEAEQLKALKAQMDAAAAAKQDDNKPNNK